MAIRHSPTPDCVTLNEWSMVNWKCERVLHKTSVHVRATWIFNFALRTAASLLGWLKSRTIGTVLAVRLMVTGIGFRLEEAALDLV
jgi:hypothetical protein